MQLVPRCATPRHKKKKTITPCALTLSAAFWRLLRCRRCQFAAISRHKSGLDHFSFLGCHPRFHEYVVERNLVRLGVGPKTLFVQRAKESITLFTFEHHPHPQPPLRRNRFAALFALGPTRRIQFDQSNVWMLCPIAPRARRQDRIVIRKAFDVQCRHGVPPPMTARLSVRLFHKNARRCRSSFASRGCG